MNKRLMSFMLALVLVVGAVVVLPSNEVSANQAPTLNVVSVLTGKSDGVINESGYAITARDPNSGRFLDVQFDVSTVNTPNFDSLGQRLVQANGAKTTYTGGLEQFYVRARTYSNTTGLETKQVFGPFRTDGSAPSISITSGMPDAGRTYDSFSVSYVMADTYSGIDLGKSNYSWSTSSTTTGGNTYKFPATTGTVTTPAGLNGTQYLHMNVMDNAGHTTTKVLGPIHLTGNGAQITFGGIEHSGKLDRQNVRINVATPANGINFGRSYYEVYRKGSSPAGNRVQLTGLETNVTIATVGDWYIYTYVVDNAGNSYNATSPVITIGKESASNVDISYSPTGQTAGTVTATMRVYDTDGSYVTPITSGVTQVNNTTFQYTFSQNGSKTVEFRTKTGRIIQVFLNVNNINNTSLYSLSKTSDGGVITLNQPSRVNYNNSWYRVGNTKRYINSPTTRIRYGKDRAGVLEVNIEETNGQRHRDTMVISNLPKGYSANLQYVNVGNRVEARMDWSGFASMKNYPKGARDRNFTYEFRDNGYGVASFRDRDNQELFFDLYVDTLKGRVEKIDIDNGKEATRYDGKFSNRDLEIKAYDLKSNRPEIVLTTERGSVDLNRSYYRVDGGRKEYFRMTTERLDLPRNWDDLFVYVENTKGDHLEGTFYYGQTENSKKLEDKDINMTGLTTNNPIIEVSSRASKNVDYKNSYFRVNNQTKKYAVKSDRQRLNLTGTGSYTVEVVLVEKGTRNEVRKSFVGQLGGLQPGNPVGPIAPNRIRYSNTNKPKYLNGYTDGSIRPDAAVTRAEFYKMLDGNLVGFAQPSVGQYTDLKANQWYYASSTRLIGMGLNAKAGNQFKPNEPITRGEAAAVLTRLNLNGDIKNTAAFIDVAGHKFTNEIYAAARKGLITGYPDGTFKPDHGIRRSEAVKMINNAVGRQTGPNSRVPVGAMIPNQGEVNTNHWAFWDIVDAMNGHTVRENKRGIDQVWTGIGNVWGN